MKLRYKIFIIGLALIGLSSCSDFLDKVPDTRVYLVNLDQLEQLLVTAYTQNNYALVGELSSDNVVDNNSPSDDGVRYHLSSYDQFDEEVYAWKDVTLDINDSDCPSGVWSGCYGAIAAANAVLQKIEEFDQAGEIEGEAITSADRARMNAIKGEAYMIRAYHHYILAQVFCMPYRGPEISKTLPGIPYATKPETELDPKYDRGTLQETYDKIEQDLLLGLEYVTEDYYEVPKYHFNIASSNAFAARFYTVKREYDKVVQYATAAFKGNDPSTMRNDFWDQTDFYYYSDIARYYSSVERPGNFMMIGTYSTWDRRFYGYRFSCARDALRGSIQGPGPSWDKCVWSYRNGKDKISFAMMPCYQYFCASAGQEYGAFFVGNCFEQFEYTDKVAGIGYVHMVRPEFTSQETILLRAEANLFLGNIDAAFDDLYLWNHEHLLLDESRNYNMTELTKEQIESFYSYYDNPTRKDPGFGIVKQFNIDEVCPSDKYHMTQEIEPYMQCVQHFRRIQMIHLGNRWFDIKRYGFSITHKMGINDVYTLEVLDPRYAIQIPSEVVGAGLEPNERQTFKPESSLVLKKDAYVRVN
ncbi:MAG: RagB/SusD family nutrient uptake outer membrane protein [Muribaculaceae bacterium]|nr:RagB/SusD family nutrient uptake outer membrane protein [Muribaculaceae bacterium]